jgi:hypothetical protein
MLPGSPIVSKKKAADPSSLGSHQTYRDLVASPARPPSTEFSPAQNASSSESKRSSKDLSSPSLLPAQRSFLSLFKRGDRSSANLDPQVLLGEPWSLDSKNPLFAAAQDTYSSASASMAASQGSDQELMSPIRSRVAPDLSQHRPPKGGDVLLSVATGARPVAGQTDEPSSPSPFIARMRTSAKPPDLSPLVTRATSAAQGKEPAASTAAAAGGEPAPESGARPRAWSKIDADLAHDVSLEKLPKLPPRKSQMAKRISSAVPAMAPMVGRAPKIKEDDDFYVDDSDDDALSFYAFFREAKHVPLQTLMAEIVAAEGRPVKSSADTSLASDPASPKLIRNGAFAKSWRGQALRSALSFRRIKKDAQ